MKRLTLMLVTGAAAAVVATGCSSSIVNTGGDTSCKDFNGQDEAKQNDELTKMLKDEKGADPTSLEITATRIAVSTYCKTLGTPDTKIKDTPHG